ncbi:MAG TPA: hypothetical protein VLH35_08090, partial [Candidatus Acidoferrales bacterium]|nr:hypothetical protein [Candidatus Acidoferrales bacterium]
MTIYVQWKWIAKTETFLMILHMDADFSDRSRNLRIAPKLFLSAKDVKNTPLGIGRHDFFYFSEDMKGRLMSEAFEEDFDRTRLKSRSIITWAPTHVETGVLAELLCYANIINGFKKEKRHSLRAYLELWASKEDREFWYKIYEVVTKDGPEGLKG